MGAGVRFESLVPEYIVYSLNVHYAANGKKLAPPYIPFSNLALKL